MSKPNTITRLGAERLRRVADEIERSGRFNYGIWSGTVVEDDHGGTYVDEESLEDDPTKLLHKCDTVGCVAGWAVAIGVSEGLIDIDRHRNYDGLGLDHSTAAAEYFGLGGGAEEELFLGGSLIDMRLDEPRREYRARTGLTGYGDDPRFDWSEAEPVEVAKMMRMIADGDHPTWEVID